MLQPYIPQITSIVKNGRNREEFSKYYPNEPEREPDLNWIFFRKYTQTTRSSLKHHVDTNMNTVNIELSDDYDGGGLFYIKPLAATGNIHPAKLHSGYEWIDTVKRENTTEIVFPGECLVPPHRVHFRLLLRGSYMSLLCVDLRAGDAIFYNYTVHHGVAPIESGARVSATFVTWHFYNLYISDFCNHVFPGSIQWHSSSMWTTQQCNNTLRTKTKKKKKRNLK